jgi:hypothetical protein
MFQISPQDDSLMPHGVQFKQTGPEEHPVESSAVVHQEEAMVIRIYLVTHDDSFNTRNMIQQTLEKNKQLCIYECLVCDVFQTQFNIHCTHQFNLVPILYLHPKFLF